MLPEDRISWAIHYLDLSVYTNTSGVWGNAPASGVLFVLETSTSGLQEVNMGMDFYYMHPMPSGAISSYLHADEESFSFLPESGIKLGNWADDSVWHFCHQEIFGV